MADEIVLSEEKLKQFGQRLFSKWEQHRDDRKAAEDHWLQNLRQFRGIYDPEVIIPKNRSRAYPKVTRWKVIGTIARLMQMLFPQSEKNYGINASPLPNLSKAQLQEVLDALVAKKAEEQQIAPEQVECTDEQIEAAISEYAKGKAARMELKLDDDLQEMEYITLVRRVVFSAVLYNIGILKGPMHVPYQARTWTRNVSTGLYEAVEVQKLKPLLEFLPVWNYYPDMSATALNKQDGTFERHVMNRRQVEDLGKRADFRMAAIDQWLHDNKSGNHQQLHWETALSQEPKSDRSNVKLGDGKKYVVLAYWGDVTGHELREAGATIAEADLAKTYHGNVWLLDNVVIKARIAVLGDEARMHHEFMFEEDDLSLLGNGQCDTLRDSQLSICESARMALDEASIGGENLVVNKEKLVAGQNIDPASYKVWVEESEGVAAQTPAVRALVRQSRLGDLMLMVRMFREFADSESGLPPPSLGDTSGGGSEALRTSKNASMFLGAAALPIRDTVRNFDSFTISVMEALVKWNMRYDPNESRDGDFDVIARGSTSLIAKEVQGQQLDVFSAALTEEERAHIKTRKLLEAKAKAHDIPTEELFETQADAEKKIASAQAAQQRMVQLQGDEIEAKVNDLMASAFKKVLEGQAAKTGATVEVVQTILEGLTNNGKGSGTGTATEGA